MNRNVLIADGDMELCDLYRMYLGECGYEVEIASNALDCLEKLRHMRPAVVVLDLNLRWGGADGVLALLRERNEMAMIPVILTSTVCHAEDRLEEVRPPVVRFLAKPFPLKTLLGTVRDAVANTPLGHLEESDCLKGCTELYMG